MFALIETFFDIFYLLSVSAIGILMMTKSKGNKLFFLFGLMAVVLEFGDAFHLIPRVWALNTVGLEIFVVQLGIGK